MASGVYPLTRALWWGLCGAVAAVLLDPQSGRGRRAQVRTRGLSVARRLGRTAPRKAAHIGGRMRGLAHHLGKASGGLLGGADPAPPPDTSQFLAHKVATALGHEPDLPRGQYNIDAVDGVVHLRGRLDRAEQVTRAIERARKVDGVRDVVSHLTTRE